jgi:uncharacterized protein (DUF2225 family)
LDIKTLLYDRKLTCPVCDRTFYSRSVKGGKVRLLKTELDLRPIYDKLDPSLYDILLCNTCGYASLGKSFNQVTSYGKKYLREKVSTQYRGKQEPKVYTYEYAIDRYKMALYDGIIMKISDLEKAYLSLKIAWLYRGFGEVEAKKNNLDKKAECQDNEVLFLKNARDGFNLAINEDMSPAFGINEVTAKFLIGETSRRIGEFDEAVKWANEVILTKYVNRRLKDRARETKRLAEAKKIKED